MRLEDLLTELSRNPQAILAWQVDEPGDRGLAVFQVEGGTKQLAHMVIRRGEVQAVTEALARRGLIPGWYGGGTGVVWREVGGVFSLWGPRGPLLRSDGQTVTLGARQTLPVTPAVEVTAFLDEDFVARGVRLRAGETEHTVVRHRPTAALGGVSYGALDALGDSGWVIYLGRELATFLGATYIDQTT